jgi:hypothetical protein
VDDETVDHHPQAWLGSRSRTRDGRIALTVRSLACGERIRALTRACPCDKRDFRPFFRKNLKSIIGPMEEPWRPDAVS